MAQTQCTKLSQQLGTSLSKDSMKEPMDNMCGHMLCLAELFISSHNAIQAAARASEETGIPIPSDTDDVRLHVMATLFDCLRKTDTSLIFRAYALHALGTVLPGCVENLDSSSSSSSTSTSDFAEGGQGQDQAQPETASAELCALVDRVKVVVESHLLAIQTHEEMPLIATCLMRLVGVALPATMKVMRERTVDYYFTVWDTLRRCHGHAVLQGECARFLTILGTLYATTGKKGEKGEKGGKGTDNNVTNTDITNITNITKVVDLVRFHYLETPSLFPHLAHVQVEDPGIPARLRQSARDHEPYVRAYIELIELIGLRLLWLSPYLPISLSLYLSMPVHHC